MASNEGLADEAGALWWEYATWVGCCTGILGTGQGYRCHGSAGCPSGRMRRTVVTGFGSFSIVVAGFVVLVTLCLS